MIFRCINRISHVLFSLFSFATLFCCVLPFLFTVLGFGATFAALISTFPFLVTLSKMKVWLFFIGFILLSINAYTIFFHYQPACPTPSSNTTNNQRSHCDTAAGWSKNIFLISTALFLIAFFAAYLAFPLFKLLGIVS